MVRGWRFIPSMHRAKADRLVHRVLLVSDNELCVNSLKHPDPLFTVAIGRASLQENLSLGFPNKLHVYPQLH